VLREAIREAGGIEVFAIGDVDFMRKVSRLEIHCRGTRDAVPALMERPRAGQVVIHNHPSGVVEASPADLGLAAQYGDNGIGVVIVDNDVTRDLWVVEPAKITREPIPRDRLRDFFLKDLPKVLPGYEPRPGQLAMAENLADALDQQHITVVEAGTGTGKSLGYLAPVVLWALANDSKVVVSTYTRSLQAQLVRDDLPALRRAGLDFRVALLKGRNNYLCRRKLDILVNDESEDAGLMARIQGWTDATEEGTLQDFGESLDDAIWERLQSDTDQTLRVRCPHYNTCFFYGSRRTAAASHVLVVNHALLLADLSVKSETGGDGLLPRYDRVILDEGHHLEDAATSVASCSLTHFGIRRATGPLLKNRRRPGALARIQFAMGEGRPRVARRCERVAETVAALREEADMTLEAVYGGLLHEKPQLRITPAVRQSALWQEDLAPSLATLGKLLLDAVNQLAALLGELEDGDAKPPTQPLLDLGRARRRLHRHAAVVGDLLGGSQENRCHWVERDGQRARLCSAPIDVGPLLEELLFSRIAAVGITSATLTVNGSFEPWLQRHGVQDAQVTSIPSPFSYRDQAILALPRDLPRPDTPGWVERVAEVTIALLEASSGGAFVLCTSYRMVNALSARIDIALGQDHPILVQGRGSRERLLERFRQAPGAILVGTDSFWEGVSVRGDGLRLVIIPRLPFRVPTEPVAQARYERLETLGKDPFRTWSLPTAVIKLRQGFGRLIRSRSDRGAVVILDRRIHDMWYGRVFLRSLPDARRITGPARVVVQQLRDFYEAVQEPE
jgi:ATP-dependent DNA helicase DinG